MNILSSRNSCSYANAVGYRYGGVINREIILCPPSPFISILHPSENFHSREMC